MLGLFGVASFLVYSNGFWPFIAIALQSLRMNDNYVQSKGGMDSGTENQNLHCHVNTVTLST